MAAKSDPMDKIFPLSPDAQRSEDILSVLEDIDEKLGVICKVLAIYAEANPVKSRKSKNVK